MFALHGKEWSTEICLLHACKQCTYFTHMHVQSDTDKLATANTLYLFLEIQISLPVPQQSFKHFNMPLLCSKYQSSHSMLHGIIILIYKSQCTACSCELQCLQCLHWPCFAPGNRLFYCIQHSWLCGEHSHHPIDNFTC